MQKEPDYRQRYISMLESFDALNSNYFIMEIICDKDGKPVDGIYREVSPATERLIGKSREEIIGKSRRELFGNVSDEFPSKFYDVLQTGQPIHFQSFGAALKKYYDVYAWKAGDNQVAAIVTDITERKKAEEAVRKSEEEYSSLFANMIDGFAYCQMVFDEEGNPVDFVYLQINDAFERITGLKRSHVVGKKVTEAIPGIIEANPELFEIYGRVATTCQKEKLEIFFKPLNMWLSISVYCPSKGYFAAVFEDITEHKKAEEALRMSEHRFRSLADNAPDVIMRFNPDLRVVYLNPKVEVATGIAAERFLGKTNEEMGMPRELVEMWNNMFCKAREYRMAQQQEFGFPSPDGLRTFDLRVVPEYDEKGSLISFLGISRDITDRKNVEEALRASEQRWATTLASIGDAVIATDTLGNIVFMNGEAELLTGWKLREASQKPVKTVFNIINEQTRLEVESPIDRVLREGIVVGLANHTVLINKDGTEAPIDDSGAPIKDKEGKSTGVVLVFRDITERKKAEKEIVSLAKFPSENPSSVLRVDQKGIILFANPSAINQLKNWQIKVGQCIPERVHQIVTDAMASGKKSEFEENVGEEIFSFLVVPITSEGYANIYGRSITKRRKTEETLLQAQSKLQEYASNLESLVEERTKKLELSSLYARNLIEASLDPLVTISVEGKITDVNKATEIATDCSREQLIGSDFSDYFTEPEKANAGYKQVLREGFVRDYPLSIKNKSGKITNVLYNAAVFRNEEGKIQGIFAAARDITELKKAEAHAQEAEKKLRNAERLAAIGATAGMVGHDIRNPLQAITSDVYLAKVELASVPDAECKTNALESLTEIEKNVEYINKIVQDLQDYAKPLNPRAQETDIKSILDEILTKNGVPKNIKVDVRVEDTAKKIMADPDYLKRIFANLTLNAVQAMPNGGKLTIHAFPDKQTNDVLITVKDTGVGIPENVKAKLFTPMMTTKSKGQGFGLAVVKRMTEGLGGTVTFESTEGKGTTFIMRLPSLKSGNNLIKR